MLKKFVDSHVGLDHIETFHDKTNIDLFGTAYEIPAKDNSFDSAICTAVLEHLEEPELALKECYRVLNKGVWQFTQFLSYGMYMKLLEIFIDLVNMD